MKKTDSFGFYNDKSMNKPSPCLRAWFGFVSLNKCKENELFVKRNLSGVNIITFPFTLLLILDPPSLVFPVFFDISFDYNAYANAINEAKNTDDFDKKILVISQYIKSLNININQIFKKQFRLKFVDKSGFFRYDKPNLIDTISHSIHLPSRVFPDKLFDSANTIQYLEEIFNDKKQELNIKRNKIKNLQRENKKILDSSLLKTKQQFNIYMSKLKRNMTTIRLSENTNLRSLFQPYNFNYTLNYPDNITIINGKLSENTATLIVNSRDFFKVIPTKYTSKDRNINVNLKEKILTINNNTAKYIIVDTISLYHQTKILSIGGSDFENYIEIPPKGTFSFSLNKYNLKSLNNNYTNLTKRKAKRKTISFGFGIKYRSTDRTTNITLYKENKYNLMEILKSYI